MHTLLPNAVQRPIQETNKPKWGKFCSTFCGSDVVCWFHVLGWIIRREKPRNKSGWFSAECGCPKFGAAKLNMWPSKQEGETAGMTQRSGWESGRRSTQSCRAVCAACVSTKPTSWSGSRASGWAPWNGAWTDSSCCLSGEGTRRKSPRPADESRTAAAQTNVYHHELCAGVRPGATWAHHIKYRPLKSTFKEINHLMLVSLENTKLFLHV